MTHLFMLLAQALQSGIATQATSPPPIVSVSTPPPPAFVQVVPARPFVGDASLSQGLVVPVRIRVAAGNQVLFEDTMRIARNAGASFSQNRSEAPVRLCSTDRYSSYGGERESLNLQLSLREESAGAQAVHVSVTWQRPSGTPACGPEGSRSVALSESVPLTAGQSATVRGDAGLTVTLTRR